MTRLILFDENLRLSIPLDVHLLERSDDQKVIVDPYYEGGSAGFERCYEQCLR